MDISSLFGQVGGAGGGGGGGKTTSSSAASVIGGRNESEQLKTLLPWIVGGLAAVALLVAAVFVSALGRK